MIIKKIAIAIFILATLNGCAQNAALLGPVYTFSSSGNIYQAGLTYSSNEAIHETTGKSVTENIQEILKPKKKDTPFQKLVKKRIRETRKKINISNQ